MGATMSTAVVHDEQAIIGQVGDSRGYLIRGGRVQQLTKEHSLVQAMLDAGQLTEERAAHSPLRHVILHALGADDQLQPQLSFFDLERGDCVLLCSDGLSNKVGDVEVHDIVREIASLGEAGERLVALTNERGGEDNITLIMARLDGAGWPLSGVSKRPAD
jgi:serine/threonine protein phosphatase PrpC